MKYRSEPPSAVREIWQGEFDYARVNVDGGVYVLSSHPQVIGRGSRLAMFESLIEHMQELGVVFESMKAYASRWRERNPLDAWRRSDSTHVGHAA